MANIRKPAEPAGAKAPAKARKLKRFRVSYRITETEWYEIDAISAEDAEANAYFDGKLVGSGSYDCQSIHCEEVHL